jgi:hypothetical protein
VAIKICPPPPDPVLDDPQPKGGPLLGPHVTFPAANVQAALTNGEMLPPTVTVAGE